MHSCICQPPAAASWTRKTFQGGASLQSLLPCEQPTLPLDLRDWANPWQIRTWIEREMNDLDWNSPHLLKIPWRRAMYETNVMVCLLSFAYATLRFSSQEIAEASRSDLTFRAICGGRAPLAHEVRTFRRYGRAVLEHVLAGVFKQALTSRLHIDLNLFSSEIEPDLRDHAANRLDIARQMDMDEE